MLSTFAASVSLAIGLTIAYFMFRAPEPPELDLERWWGSGYPGEEDIDTSIRPFEIDFNDTMIEDLKIRLRNRRPLKKPLDNIQSEYGINTYYLQTVLDYWHEDYDFKKRAQLLNEFPHYKTKIQGLDIHFIRVKPDVKNVKILPLLMLHGWPSSSKEFDKVIPILTKPRKEYNFVFEVIAADLPGYGFSEGTSKLGLNPVQIGVIMRNLMMRLGFEKFYIQAGDWGSQCATHMATLFPNQVLGLHTNMPLSSMPGSTIKLILGSFFPRLAVDKRCESRIYPLRKLVSYLFREGGYFHIQATKPDTIGVALTDSPSGLAAYIIEKMAICSSRTELHTPHGGLQHLDLDDVLDTITITWVNNCIVTSMRLYAEAFVLPEVQRVHNIPTYVPTAAINFLNEVLYQPDWILRDKFKNLVRSTVIDAGGHFAALQSPQTLSDDIFDAAVEFLKFHENKE